MNNIPSIDFAFIGGSSTHSLDFPEALKDSRVQVLESNRVYKTPYGDSPPFKIFSVGEKKVATLKMHGWRPGVSRADASRQIFWVFREIGVKKILAEGGVGSVNHLMDPGDVMVPHDYIDLSMRKDVSIADNYLSIMRQGLCPTLRQTLYHSARKHTKERVFSRGIYAVTDGRHFESPAEVAMMAQWQVDGVGQSICPEVYLAREIGACYAGVYFIVNYAEGVVRDWSHEELKEIFYTKAEEMGRIILDALEQLTLDTSCGCKELRKETLIK